MSSNSRPSNDDDVVIVCAVRTPLCRASKNGAFKETTPASLLSVVLQECTKYVNPSDIEDVCVGNVLSPASGAAAFRMAQLAAGFPSGSSLYTTNRQCSSGLQAVANIANSIQAGNISIGIGAGVESMSTHSMKDIPMPDVDWNAMKGTEAMDCIIPMGVTSEHVVQKYGLSREKLDAFAAESHRRAAAAQAAGKFDAEIVPVGSVTRDDGIRANTSPTVLSKLRPVFDENGVTTAGNSSQMTDGAAAVLLMTRAEAQRRNLAILGIWRGFAVKGVPPRIMGIGPAVAIPAVLEKVGLDKKDIGVYEINEAFASQASWCIDELHLDPARVNPNGGAIALGHPLGCTGARQIATLLNELHRTKRRFGVVSMCIGTGMGAAAVIEVEPKSGL
jgi:acetyl-CoA acyltransferase 1